MTQATPRAVEPDLFDDVFSNAIIPQVEYRKSPPSPPIVASAVGDPGEFTGPRIAETEPASIAELQKSTVAEFPSRKRGAAGQRKTLKTFPDDSLEKSHRTPTEKMLPDKLVARRYHVSRITIWRWSKKGEGFPSPVIVSEGVTRWLISDLDAYDAVLRRLYEGQPASRVDPAGNRKRRGRQNKRAI